LTWSLALMTLIRKLGRHTVRPAVVCSGHCIACTVVLVEGWLQARRERRCGLQVPEVLIEASANIVE
jgi:hypothetical protein